MDGSHIKGLVINLFHTFWPRLVEGHISLPPSTALPSTQPHPPSLATSPPRAAATTSAPSTALTTPLTPSPSFLEQFITPVIKARRAGDGRLREFYSMKEFERWRAEERPSPTPSPNATSSSGVVSSAVSSSPAVVVPLPLPTRGGGKAARAAAAAALSSASSRTNSAPAAPSAAAGGGSTVPREVGEARIGKWTCKYYKGELRVLLQ